MSLRFGTEPMYKRLSMMLTEFLSCSSRGWTGVCCLNGDDTGFYTVAALTDGPYQASTGRSDRQPDHPVYILPALPLSLLNDGFISLPCLNASWGFDALHAKNTVKKGGEQKITYLALWRMEIWTELKLKHSALTFTHKKQTTVNGCLQTISSLSFCLKVTLTCLVVPLSTF